MRIHIASQSKVSSRYFQLKFLGKLALAAIVAVAACLGIVRWQEHNVDYWKRFTAKRHERLRTLPEISVGDSAPEFALKTKDGQQVVNFNQVSKEKPVALVFGSYT